MTESKRVKTHTIERTPITMTGHGRKSANTYNSHDLPVPTIHYYATS